MVDFHTDFWERKLSKTPRHYFSNWEIRKIKNVLLESYIIDDIKAYVGVMEECCLRKKALLAAEMEVKWSHVNGTNEQELPLEISRINAIKTQMDPFRVAIELEEFT